MHPKRSIPGIGLMFLAVMVFLMAGCSDDDNPLPSAGQVNGSFDDPEFLLVQDQVEDFLTSTEQMFILGLDNVYQLPTDTEYVRNMYGPMGPDDIVQYDYAGGWHVTYIAHFNPFADDFFRDSVQFQVNSQPVEDPDGLDWMQYIRYWGYTSNVTTQTHTNQSGYVNFQFENLDENYATVNGFNNTLVEWNYVSEDSTVEAVFDMDMTVADVVIGQVPSYGWISGCPLEGNMTFGIEQAYNVSIGETNDFRVRSWDVWVTFDMGVADISISSENEIWNFQCDVCNPAVIY